MKRYKDWSPSEHDTKGLNGDHAEINDWFVLPVMLTRDSSLLEESNFATASKMLKKAPDDYAVHRFGHWACGWFEIIVVRPDTEAMHIGERIEAKLEDYPILDEDDFYRREWEAMGDWWFNASIRERIAMCAREGVSIFAARRHGVIPNKVQERMRNNL